MMRSRHTGLSILGWATVGLVALPAMLFLILFGRVLAAIVVGLALVGGLGALVLSRRFRAALQPDAAPVEHQHGVRVPRDVLVDERHVWVKPSGRLAFIGVDDLLQRALGPIDHVVLPALGNTVAKGEVLFSVMRGGRRVDVRAPMAGRVYHRNRALLRRPGVMATSPYDAGWAVALDVSDLPTATKGLRAEPVAARWFRDEVDRLLHAVSPAGPMPAMPDGGLLSPEFHELLDDSTWDRIRGDFFERTPKAEG